MFNQDDMARIFKQDQEDTRTEDQRQADIEIARRGCSLQCAYNLYTDSEHIAELVATTFDARELPNALIQAAQEFYNYVYHNKTPNDTPTTLFDDTNT